MLYVCQLTLAKFIEFFTLNRSSGRICVPFRCVKPKIMGVSTVTLKSRMQRFRPEGVLKLVFNSFSSMVFWLCRANKIIYIRH